jgi:hypothetical protein
MNSVHQTLESRGETYGDYSKGLHTRAKIMSLLNEHRNECANTDLTELERVALLDMVNKLVRLAGATNHVDSVHDLAGYATLYQRHLTGEK